MRALLKDKEDGTLIALEVQEAIYDGEVSEMYLDTIDSTYVVEQIPKDSAQTLIRVLFERDLADFTSYPAHLDD